MAELTTFTDKPFPQAVGDILRARHGDSMGRYPLGPFIERIQDETGMSYEYIRLMLRGERTLRVDLIEAVAKILGLEPEYFVEYRQYMVQKKMASSPEIVDKLYALVVVNSE